MNGLELIIIEREKQIAKGKIIDQDLQYNRDELLMAAISYIRANSPSVHNRTDETYPWSNGHPGLHFVGWDKTEQINNLAAAGALIAAQIDVLLVRQEEHEKEQEHAKKEIKKLRATPVQVGPLDPIEVGDTATEMYRWAERAIQEAADEVAHESQPVRSVEYVVDSDAFFRAVPVTSYEAYLTSATTSDK